MFFSITSTNYPLGGLQGAFKTLKNINKNKTYENKIEAVEYEKRLSVIEYGNYHIKYCLNDIREFDLKKLIWNFDYGLYEYRDKYFFSNIFIADFDGIYKLAEYIENNNQKSLTVEFDWPLDGQKEQKKD